MWPHGTITAFIDLAIQTLHSPFCFTCSCSRFSWSSFCFICCLILASCYSAACFCLVSSMFGWTPKLSPFNYICSCWASLWSASSYSLVLSIKSASFRDSFSWIFASICWICLSGYFSWSIDFADLHWAWTRAVKTVRLAIRFVFCSTCLLSSRSGS